MDFVASVVQATKRSDKGANGTAPRWLVCTLLKIFVRISKKDIHNYCNLHDLPVILGALVVYSLHSSVLNNDIRLTIIVEFNAILVFPDKGKIVKFQTQTFAL